MSTLEELDDLDRQEREDKDKKDERKDGDDKKDKKTGADADGDAEMKDAESDDVLDEEILNLSTDDILTRKRLLENDARINRSELQRLTHEKATMSEKIKENLDKIANNRYVLQKQKQKRKQQGQ
jgi:26S proteasome regulatory subunit T5